MISVGKDWRVRTDASNIILERRRRVLAKGKKPAHDYWCPEGYYSTVKNALEDLVELKVRESNLKDLKTVVAEIDRVYKLIEKVTK